MLCRVYDTRVALGSPNTFEIFEKRPIKLGCAEFAWLATSRYPGINSLAACHNQMALLLRDLPTSKILGCTLRHRESLHVGGSPLAVAFSLYLLIINLDVMLGKCLDSTSERRHYGYHLPPRGDDVTIPPMDSLRKYYGEGLHVRGDLPSTRPVDSVTV